MFPSPEAENDYLFFYSVALPIGMISDPDRIKLEIAVAGSVSCKAARAPPEGAAAQQETIGGVLVPRQPRAWGISWLPSGVTSAPWGTRPGSGHIASRWFLYEQVLSSGREERLVLADRSRVTSRPWDVAA